MQEFNGEEFKEKVRSQADIVKIVSDYVALKKRGGRYWGCCPFHGEKTPSFTVDEAKGLFHCFGCNVGGDVFSFIMQIEHLSFPDALKFLANKLNIPIPTKEKSPQEIARDQETKAIYDANALALKFFESCLVNTSYGKTAQDYLLNRGITAEIRAKFSLGLAPPDMRRLHSALEQRGVTQDTLLKAGLVMLSSRNQSIYDFFQARIMIPIKNPRGQVVAFQGRKFDDSRPRDLAKYKNTAETQWFSKRNVLFGLDVALKAIRAKKQVILVEGPMDAISLHAAGIDWAVASMGTAFSEQHAHMLRKLDVEAVFSFDHDEAGLKADMRAVEIARHIQLPCKVVVVNVGKDPDEFIRGQGAEAYLQLVENAPSGLDFQIEQILNENNIDSLEGKVKAVSNIIPLLLLCSSNIEVAQRLKELAHRLTIDEGLLQEELRKAQRGSKTEAEVPLPTLGANPARLSVKELAERHLLHALSIDTPTLLSKFATQLDTIKLGTIRLEILMALQAKAKEGVSFKVENIYGKLSPTALAEYTVILLLDLPAQNMETVVFDCFYTLHNIALEEEYRQHSTKAAEYEKEGNPKFKQELEDCRRIKNKMIEVSERYRERRESHD